MFYWCGPRECVGRYFSHRLHRWAQMVLHLLSWIRRRIEQPISSMSSVPSVKSVAKVFLTVALIALPVRAHDTWLQPVKFSVPVGATVTLDMTSADGFKGPATAIKADRIALSTGYVAGNAVTLKEGPPSEKTLRLVTVLPQAGVAVLGVELKPRLLDLAADKIELYFSEIHADAALRAKWAAVPEPRKWRELYVKNTKTFVRVGEISDRGWTQPLGLRLEIMPERDPTTLRVGDDLPVRVLRDGKPFPGFTVGYVAAGETKEHVAITDADGRAHAVLDATGPWLIHGTDLRRVMHAEREWESDFTTMVVEAK